MKHIIIIIFFFSLLSKANPSKGAEADTIYIKCYQEQQSSKFNHIGSLTKQLSVHYFFDVDYTLYNYKQNSIMLIFKSPAITKGTNTWVIKEIDTGKASQLKNVLSLEQFTQRLSNPDLCSAIIRKQVTLIMLYGTRCTAKFEVLPVLVGTDLYDPIDVIIPPKPKDKN